MPLPPAEMLIPPLGWFVGYWVTKTVRHLVERLIPPPPSSVSDPDSSGASGDFSADPFWPKPESELGVNPVDMVPLVMLLKSVKDSRWSLHFDDSDSN